MYQVVTGGVPETQELLKQRFDHIFGETGYGSSSSSSHTCDSRTGWEKPLLYWQELWHQNCLPVSLQWVIKT